MWPGLHDPQPPDSHRYDAGGQVKGRNRHLCVDVLGIILVAKVTSADVQDRNAAECARRHRASDDFPALSKV
ncbi:hypothetical protein DRW03_16345 [Corallococcus sp. H22C18031201]|nr:hypothetical protein DRW03_16345 [Corallococcus sp. H22C18031201]